MPLPPPPRSFWKWGVCGLLLLATMINYMDRLTLNQSAKRMMDDVGFKKDGYGNLEAGFGAAFAAGSLVMGLLVDRVNVWWVYPTMVALWSMAGAATGQARNYEELLACRIALGFFEAANWPCALRATQRLLIPEERAMGNGILQSGAAIGAVITPQVVKYSVLRWDDWRPPFYFVGAAGLAWVVLWLAVVRPRHLSLKTLPPSDRPSDAGAWPALQVILSDRRFWVLAVVVVTINLTWHFFRAWMPLFLQEQHNYSESSMNNFTSFYYVSADLGSWSAGLGALFLARRGWAVHSSRMTVFFVCAVAMLLSFAAAFLPRGPLLLAVLLVMGFFALGLFPNYYSFSQELTTRHQGKVTGMLGACCWVAIFFMQSGVGRYIERTREYTLGVAVAGLPPLVAFLALAFFWKRARAEAPTADLAAKPEPVSSAALASRAP
jgi:ACS family hexuronate transporter-like MFS transporter